MGRFCFKFTILYAISKQTYRAKIAVICFDYK